MLVLLCSFVASNWWQILNRKFLTPFADRVRLAPGHSCAMCVVYNKLRELPLIWSLLVMFP